MQLEEETRPGSDSKTTSYLLAHFARVQIAQISSEHSNLGPSALLSKEAQPQPQTTASDSRTASQCLSPGRGFPEPPLTHTHTHHSHMQPHMLCRHNAHLTHIHLAHTLNTHILHMPLLPSMSFRTQPYERELADPRHGGACNCSSPGSSGQHSPS